MQRTGLMLARLLLCFWVGGAALFVVTSIAEQLSPNLSETVKNQLALIRFPWYYRFGFTLVGGTLIAGHFARNHPVLSGSIRWCVFGCLASAFLLLVIDYVWIYRPLAEMLTPPDRAIPSRFVELHRASKWINLVQVSLCFFACVGFCRSAARPATEN